MRLTRGKRKLISAMYSGMNNGLLLEPMVNSKVVEVSVGASLLPMIEQIPSKELLKGLYQVHGISWIGRKLHINKRRVYRLLREYGILIRSKGQHVKIAGDSEQSIYQALGLPYQRPEERR